MASFCLKSDDMTSRRKERTCHQVAVNRLVRYASTVLLVALALLASCSDQKTSVDEHFFKTRGLVLAVEDLSTVDWPTKAKEAGITTIATHVTPSQVAAFIQSPKGQNFLAKCKALGIEVEHELHAINDLLPRELFSTDSTMFRMNQQGRRVADFNLCVHSEKALEMASQNAVKYAKILTPTTGRYFYWIDDGRPMCYCRECAQYSDSEQALILENYMIKALKTVDPKAKLAHLAYANTLQAPRKIKPEAGIFLEFAPIQRSFEKSLSDSTAKVKRMKDHAAQNHGDVLKLLDDNLEVFGSDDAQALEYWLDVSLFSGWKKPATQLPWNRDVFRDDIKVYAKRGIKHITTFAVFIDSTYVHTYKDMAFLYEYGKDLESYPLPGE